MLNANTRYRAARVAGLASFRRSSRRAASAAIEQRDGPDGMGRDDARGSKGGNRPKPPERALMPG